MCVYIYTHTSFWYTDRLRRLPMFVVFESARLPWGSKVVMCDLVFVL